jgi:glycosyltransferase involved in cell wall biosynthesis
VIVDDCSTDDSIQTIRRLIGHTPGCRLILHEDNCGYSAAKNTAIRASLGDYIRLIDADDVLTPTAIEAAMKVFREDPKLDLVHGIALRWYGGTDLRGYNKKTYVHAQGRMYRRRVYDKFGLYYEGLRSMADKEMVFRLGVHPESPFKKKVKDRKIPDVVAWYRKHDNAMHKVRRRHPGYNKRLKAAFNRRIKQLKNEGITKENTPWL